MTDATILGLPFFYVVGPLAVFGPVVLTVFYNLVLKDLFRSTPVKTVIGESRRQAETRKWSARDTAWFYHGGRKNPSVIVMYGGQAVLYGLFALTLAIFSAWPPYQTFEPGQALLKLTFSHPGQRKEACRKRSREELMKLAPNMRAPVQCGRERWPVSVVVWVDDHEVYRNVASPSGLSNDGASAMYATFPLPEGNRQIRAELRDSGADSKPYRLRQSISLNAASVYVLGFDEFSDALYLR